MKGNLVIVESPTKAKKIQSYLGADYTVKSSQGHIRDLNDKNLSIDIANSFAPIYEVPSSKAKIVGELKKLADNSETVWLASDEDREGEAISWHLSQVLNLDKSKTKRIVFHEITKNAILEAVEHPRDIDMNLVSAQQARRVLDRLVGFELSPVLWRKIQPKLSAGRVQSVALRLIVDREREIQAFKSDTYYKVDALFIPEGSKEGIKATLDQRFSSEAEAYAFLEQSIGARYHIGDISEKEGLRKPASPFTTSLLQQEAARKLGFSVSQTMQVAQKLYEEGLITYMRTDSTNLSQLAINTAKKFITENFGAEYSSPRQYKTKSKGAQEAHEAIRPTYIENPSIKGSTAEKRLYELIWKRTVASQMSDARLLNTSIEIISDKSSLKYKAEKSRILFDGFMKVYIDGNEEEKENSQNSLMPALKVGMPLIDKEIHAECKFTAAPPRYNQGSLVKKLEELEIGRPSTYSSTINTLIKSRGYVVEGDKEGRKVKVSDLMLKNGSITTTTKEETVGAEKRKLLPQDIGIMVTDYLLEHFPNVMDYGFTAAVEDNFDKVASGELQWNKLIADFYSPFHENIKSSMSENKYTRLERVIGTDPADGKQIIAKYGQYGPYVQKGEDENKVYASLAPGQIIESLSLEDALRLFQLPRTLGEYEGKSVIAAKGRYGAYLKHGDRNIKFPRGIDPLNVSLEQAIAIIKESDAKPAQQIIAEWNGMQVINGSYGPYIKFENQNYKIPKDLDAYNLKEEDVKNIISNSEPTSKRRGKFRKK